MMISVIVQQLEYVAISRAPDTATVISNNVKEEGSPLHPEKSQSSESSKPVVSLQSIMTNDHTKDSSISQQLINHLKSQGINVKDRAAMEEFLKTHKVEYLQQAIDNINQNSALKELDEAIKTGNWNDEALEQLENLNIEEYGRILERFSQEELRKSNGILTQAETIIARGNGSTNSEDSSKNISTRTKEQEQQIESWAKEEGLWYNNYIEAKDGSLESVIEADGGKFSDKSGSETLVYWTKEGVTKAIDASHYNGNLQGLLDKIVLHNSIFPETTYEVIGFGRDRGRTFRVIAKQKFIEGEEPTIENIQNLADKLGLTKQGGWYYTKDSKGIADLNPKNIIKVPSTSDIKEDTFFVIDCDIKFTQSNTQHSTIVDNNGNQLFTTPQGEVYGFVDKEGNIYLDETKISPEHPIHEYTHLWDRTVKQKNPKLWQRGMELMKQTSLWDEILNDEHYGKVWQPMNLQQEKLDSLIASEVHARFTGDIG